MATTLTDEEIHDVLCALRFVNMMAKDHYLAKGIDYLKRNDRAEGITIDKDFLKNLRSVDEKYTKAMKELGSPLPTKK